MNFLDIRTVMFSQLITDALCTLVLIALWQENRKRYAGLSFWVLDFILQTVSALLILLRGRIPDWLSIIPTGRMSKAVLDRAPLFISH
ncbi:MAG TPA: hypothetical protein VKF38_10195 [Anaerolineaceae bacterium]|nr:hypothetical protein [Anaerolineaceae bacterium]